jgi:hypothetical protein
MTRQRNVKQQNALTTEDILKAAALFRESDRQVAWLSAALRSRGEAASSGLLVAFRTVPDQGGGDWVKGIWLTSDRRFWEFEAVVPRQDGEAVVIERLEDATSVIQVSAHVPGTGKTFGHLALDVLDGRTV